MKTRVLLLLFVCASFVSQAQKLEIGKAVRRPTLDGVYNASLGADGTLILTPKTGGSFPVPVSIGQVRNLNGSLRLRAFASDVSNLRAAGKQLFNIDDAGNYPGHYINTLGDTTTDANSTESHFIKVSPNTIYTESYKGFVTYYSKDQLPLGVGAAFDRLSNSFTTSPATEYVRATVPNSLLNSFQLEVGTIATSYEKYRAVLTGETRTALLAQKTVLLSKVLNRQLSGGKNLYSKTDTDNRDGYYITPAGNFTAATGYTVSGFISVTPNTPYVANGAKQGIAFFDSLQAPLGTGAAFDRPATSFTVTSGTYYIRTTLATADKASYMLEPGSVSSPVYAPFSISLDVSTPQATLAQAVAQQATTQAFYLKRVMGGVFVQGKNLFDAKAADRTDNAYLDENNNPISYVGGLISGYIAVKPATIYTPSNQQFVCFYDSTQAFISGLRYDRASLSVTTPARCAFVRLTVIGDPALFQFEEGSTSTTVYPYSYRPAVNLSGKRIWLGGTSIQALGGYWEMASNSIGATLINKAVPSSTIRKADKNGSFSGVPWQNVAYSLSMTLAEKRDLIANWSTYRSQFILSPPATLTPADTVYFLNCSYERSLVPYLNGTLPMPDLFVLSHGYNDRFSSETTTEFSTIPATRNNRNTYLGASNYIIDVILSYNPRAKIVFEGHYENQLDPRVAQGQQVLADYWQFPILKLWEKLGWGQNLIPGTQSNWATAPWSSYSSGANTSADMSALRYWLPDNVHIHSDPSGKARDRATGPVATFLTQQ